ncbi:GLPGLI family protein [Mucilaginibacter sp. KACC 22063]|uniref:GLPGLI family protein n=1 Tax=Mucilaginibacter sp. KACC 22063 TaxID=3025666 RepID=UPI002366B260|nr:GLPGLI family protein [Mucilaginibacter sp. KACC 22063]WDF54600.1 GLPGLI family protein [Mucilaginibacter sp. KACC 22063]
MKYLSITIAFIIAFTQGIFAQGKRFTPSGTIEFEKTVNMYALIQKMIDKDNESFYAPLFDQYKKQKPQFKKLKSTLTFGKGQTLFTPTEDEDNDNTFGSPMVSQNNTTYTDLTTGMSVTQKKVYENLFLVKDTVRRIKWKITDERRDIAGYPCRRANALVMDSIYVVAFYTDEIPTSGGPESFTGLPGMILGLAMPHENITWFATKVTDQPIPANNIKPPVKGKPMDNKKLKETILGAMADWGNYGKSALKALML